MKNAESAIEYAIYLCLFLTALVSGIMLSESNQLELNYADEVISGADHDLVMAPRIEGSETVQGAAVVQSIFHIHDIHADIQVDGLLFDKNLDMEYTDVSMIDVRGTYRSDYVRDQNGMLQKVIFRKV
ncbi:hypothetical protein ACVWZB_004749 [Paenibacillus polymyxa]